MKARTIIAAVAEEFLVSPTDIKGLRRFKYISQARVAVYYLMQQQPTWSYPMIGRIMKRDHTTVISGVRRCVFLMHRNEEYRRKVERISRRLGESHLDPPPHWSSCQHLGYAWSAQVSQVTYGHT